MAERKTAQQKAEDIDKQIEQLKKRRKEILQKDRIAERKARTHRLVQIGAVVENAFGFEVDPEMLAAYFAAHMINKDGSNGKTVGETQAYYYQKNAERIQKEKQSQNAAESEKESLNSENKTD